MDSWEWGIFGGIICFCCLILFIWLAVEEVKAQRAAIPRRHDSAPARPSPEWWCLGPCERAQAGARPADGLCPLCRAFEQEAGVLV